MKFHLLALILPFVSSFKFLAYNPLFGRSHVNFINKISDSLVEAGHEVIMLAPQTNEAISIGTTKAKVIHIPHTRSSRPEEKVINDIVTNLWLANDPVSMIIQFTYMFTSWIDHCEVITHHPGLMENLRAEKFDAAFAESIEPCGLGIFELLGIENRAVTQTVAIVDGTFFFTQTPANTAYVPSLIVAPSGEKMSFMDRVWNTACHLLHTIHNMNTLRRYEPVFKRAQEGYPSLEEAIAKISLVFMNSDPLLDFPAPRSSRIIDIGGISVSFGHSKLNETWSSILDLRPRTILLSFGTFVQSHPMPEQYKNSIIEAFRKFLNVTFIWKYEKPEHRITEGTENVIETTWVPQHDMLNDPRLTAFITHGGQGSVTEANTAGVPLIVIPVITDQIRNAQQVKRNGLGIVVDKESLETPIALERAIEEILSDSTYAEKARKTARMLAKKPFTAREVFVRNMEFLAEFGPLRQLDHYGAQLNFMQYYLIDVFAFLIAITLLPFILAVIILRKIIFICSTKNIKSKQE